VANINKFEWKWLIGSEENIIVGVSMRATFTSTKKRDLNIYMIFNFFYLFNPFFEIYRGKGCMYVRAPLREYAIREEIIVRAHQHKKSIFNLFFSITLRELLVVKRQRREFLSIQARCLHNQRLLLCVPIRRFNIAFMSLCFFIWFVLKANASRQDCSPCLLTYSSLKKR
jgi:hypothetical protein